MSETDRGARRGWWYDVFDQCIRSDWPLADLPESKARTADWAFDSQGEPLSGEGWEWVHDWRDPDGGLQLTCARKGPDYRLRFPGLADFHIQFEDARVRAAAADTTAQLTLGQTFLDQVLPRVLFHWGRLVVHASAVTTPDGRAVAFLGPSGTGKSTLAASYLDGGARFLTDDCLLLQPGDSGFVGIASYPALRLWPDSLAALGAGSKIRSHAELDSGKARLNLIEAAESPVAPPLSALFLLGDPATPPDSGVLVKPLTGARAMMSVIESAFVLDPVSRDAIEHNFALVSTLARSALPMFSLNYPRRYDILSEVQLKVAEVVEDCDE